jgi:hypothetical protein
MVKKRKKHSFLSGFMRFFIYLVGTDICGFIGKIKA